MPLWRSGKAISVLKGHLWLDMLPFNKNGNVWDQVSTVAARFTSTVLIDYASIFKEPKSAKKQKLWICNKRPFNKEPFSEAIDIDKKKPRELRKYSGNSFPVTLKEDHKL